MGEMQVPADAYYGAQTARAVENFPISSLRFSRQFIKALGLNPDELDAVRRRRERCGGQKNRKQREYCFHRFHRIFHR